MSQRENDATSRISVLLGSLLATAFALSIPTLLGPNQSADGALVAVSLAVVALAAAALVHVGCSLAGLSTRSLVASPSRGRDASPVPVGRATDPTHQPLRPRAPGRA